MVSVGSFKDRNNILGEDQLLIGRDDKNLNRGIGSRDDTLALARHGVLIDFLVQNDSNVFQALKRNFPDFPTHFTDTSGKDDGVKLAGGGQVGADVFLEAVALNVERQLAA
jgi:hypothetical protein